MLTKEQCLELQNIWERWHLNDMRAGTPKQMEALRAWRKTVPHESYAADCKMLESIGLLYDGDYKYGSKWLKEDVPITVLEWLFSLPGFGHTFYDVFSPEIDDKTFEAVINFG